MDPVVTCAKFTFRVENDEQVLQARQLMHRAAMEMPADFEDELPRWRVRSTIALPMTSSKFVLTSLDGRYRDKHELTVLHVAGGVPTLKHNPGREGECTTDAIVSEFARLRSTFLARWGHGTLEDPRKPVTPQPDVNQASSTSASGR